MINNKMYLSLTIGNNARYGVVDHMLGLREDYRARDPKGKTFLRVPTDRGRVDRKVPQ